MFSAKQSDHSLGISDILVGADLLLFLGGGLTAGEILSVFADASVIMKSRRIIEKCSLECQ